MKLFSRNKHASSEDDDIQGYDHDLTMTEFEDDDGTIPPPPPSSPPPGSVSHYTDNGDHVSIVSSVKGQEHFHDNTRGAGENSPFVSNDDDLSKYGAGAGGYSKVPIQGHFRGMMNAQTFDEQDAGMDEIEVPSSSVVDRWNQWEEKYALRKKCRNYGVAIVGCVLVILAVVLGSVFGTRGGGGDRGIPANETGNNNNGDVGTGGQGGGAGGQGGGAGGQGGGAGTGDGDDAAPPTAGAGGDNFDGPAYLNSPAGQAMWSNALLPESTKEDLENEDEDSAAFKAWQWIESDTNNAYAFENMDGEKAQLDLMQRFALATFSNSIDLEGFEGWNSADDVCTWAGVTCGDENGSEDTKSKVTGIMFLFDDVVGTLPPEMFLLQDLKTIAMAGNQISGEIPDEIYSLPQLQTLDLQRNMISGPISPAIGNAKGLMNLYLGRNLISGFIPLELFNLENLIHLWLDFNPELNRQNLPEEIGQLQNLEELKLGESKLVGNLPATIGSLEKLQLFHAQKNGLDGEIPDISNLKALVELDLSDNWFEGRLPIMRDFGQLTLLRLGGNLLNGNIPNHYGDFQALTHLTLGPNTLEYYDNAGLEGEVPPSLGALGNIEILDLSGNNLTGEIPAEICELYDSRLDEVPPTTISVKADCEVECDCCNDDCDRDV